MTILVILCLLLSTAFASAQTLSDAALQQIVFEEKLGATVSPSLAFRDENGQAVRIGDYFGKRPIILDLGYYGCPMLCTTVLNGMIGGLQDIKKKMGSDYEVVNVSIDPTETPTLAAAKKQSYVTRFGQPQAAVGWHFLTGNEPAIRQLAQEVGFHYAYDASLHLYAHPSGLVVLSPAGKVSHYLSGVDFSGAELDQALNDAARARVGSPVEQIFLLCFHYNPITGKYSGIILTVVRAFSVAVMVGLVAFITGAWRRRRAAAQKGS